jgi:hypothetical protein
MKRRSLLSTLALAAALCIFAGCEGEEEDVEVEEAPTAAVEQYEMEEEETDLGDLADEDPPAYNLEELDEPTEAPQEATPNEVSYEGEQVQPDMSLFVGIQRPQTDAA